ncbi:hypothetical protein NM688_g5071 [Phlebia brevispora]|uniref:Uncharacterized protein n=1 Tax=Phlebia brevispora TaxID=194682 RepID=A0ACC1T0U9_9APHY|nr:hypothetical protein NM688_g5071 [Phlebia brevispora]
MPPHPLSPSFSSFSDEELFKLSFLGHSPTPLPSFMSANLAEFQSQKQVSRPRTRSAKPRPRPSPVNSLERQQKAFKKELRNASTLMSLDFDVETSEVLMVPVHWLKNKLGKPVPLNDLVKYAQEHEFLERMSCLCILETGCFEPVRLFKPGGEKDGAGGCTWFVNLEHLLRKHPNQDTVEYPLKQRLFYGGPKAQAIADSFPSPSNSGWRPPPRFPPLQRALPLTEEESRSNVQVNPFLVDGGVADADRLFDAVDVRSITMKVCEVAPPNFETTVSMLRGLLRHGIKAQDLLRILGVCNICGDVLALCSFPTHGCIADSVTRRDDGSWISSDARVCRRIPFPTSAELEDLFYNATPSPPHSQVPKRSPQPFPLAHWVQQRTGSVASGSNTPSSSAASLSTADFHRLYMDSSSSPAMRSTPSTPFPYATDSTSDTTPSPSTSAAAETLVLLSASSSSSFTASSSSQSQADSVQIKEEKMDDDIVVVDSSISTNSRKRKASTSGKVAVDGQKKRFLGHIDLTEL